MTVRNPRVYIVEDEALIAMDLEDRLTELGYTVCGVAARGEVALEEIPEGRPDVVLMDVRLAGRKSGIDTAADLRKHSDVPIIFLSAFADVDLKERTGALEPCGHVGKPIGDRQLMDTLRAMLDRPKD